MAYDDPRDDALGPLDDARINPPGERSVWAAARRSFVEDGCSCELVAERHGLSPRTVRQHAADEGWRRMRIAHRAAERRLAAECAPDDPAEAAIAERHAERRLEMLMAPSSDVAQRLAAWEIKEALARGAPEQAHRWQKVFSSLARDSDALDRAFRGGIDANDRARLAYFRKLWPDADDRTAPDDAD